jgi:hypothetical protein
MFKKLKDIKTYAKAEDVPLGIDLYREANELGMTFWQYLEVIQPSKEGDKLDAFERQLKACGIITKSNPDAGLYSSPGEYFFQSDRPGAAILFPVLLQKTALWAKLNRVADINKIVATTRTIAGTSAFQALNIDDSEITGADGKGRRFRVDQRGNFPRVKISWSEKTNAVTKHGVQLDWTYEFVRRASIELMQTVVARIMLQDQKEVLNDAVNIAINGDGTGANPAATVKTFCISTIAPGANEIQLPTGVAQAAGALPYEGYLQFIGGMQPYTPNIVCGTLNTLVKFVTMSRPNMDPSEIITRLQEAKSQGTVRISEIVFPNVELILIDSMPESKLLAMDSAFALERVIELNSDIQEAEKVISNQTEKMVLSIADTVSKLFPEAIQVLDFSSAARSA